MTLADSDRISRIVFYCSLAVIGFLYGFAAHGFGWFPSRYLERAWRQARAVSPLNSESPGYVKPRVYENSGVTHAAAPAFDSDFTLIASLWKKRNWGPGIKLLDSEGQVLHAWWPEPGEIFSVTDVRRGPTPLEHRQLHGTHLLKNGDVLANVEPVGTVRIDACGNVIWKIPNGGHHSIVRADDGSFWIPGKSQLAPPVTGEHPNGLPGLKDSVYHDRILNISADGHTIRSINVFDLLYANDLKRYIARAGELGSQDITHLNDIEPLSADQADEYPLFEAGDLLVSLRNIHLVFVFDPNTLDVKWYASDPFTMQHDPDFIGDGWIGVFDNNRDGTNRGSMLGGSRIVAVQPHTDSTKVLFPTEHSEPFYTEKMGKWQMLENGNLLLTEAWAGRIVEVDPQGRTVWEWIHEPYDINHVPWVQEGTRYRLTREDVAKWPCSPEHSAREAKESAP